MSLRIFNKKRKRNTERQPKTPKDAEVRVDGQRLVPWCLWSGGDGCETIRKLETQKEKGCQRPQGGTKGGRTKGEI